jgi:hypothetical protein
MGFGFCQSLSLEAALNDEFGCDNYRRVERSPGQLAIPCRGDSRPG